ncbi:MAG: ATP-binding protein [Bacillota bacterium]|nr:ATP-binding protein [Bacillota bacterium]
MVKLIVGRKGTGKTKMMIELANEAVEKCDGSVVFMNKNKRLVYDLKYQIRVVCMDDFPHITNIDEYIGFIYGIISSDHDLEIIFIDGIMHHKDVQILDMDEFLERLRKISQMYEVDFIVSISAELQELGKAAEGCEILHK